VVRRPVAVLLRCEAGTVVVSSDQPHGRGRVGTPQPAVLLGHEGGGKAAVFRTGHGLRSGKPALRQAEKPPALATRKPSFSRMLAAVAERFPVRQ
jgi:hypothetical protein